MNNSKPASVLGVPCEMQRSSPSIHFHSKKINKINPTKQTNKLKQKVLIQYISRLSQDIHLFIWLITRPILGRGTYPTCHREYPRQVTRPPDGSSCFSFVNFLYTLYTVFVKVVEEVCCVSVCAGTNFLQKSQQLKYVFPVLRQTFHNRTMSKLQR